MKKSIGYRTVAAFVALTVGAAVQARDSSDNSGTVAFDIDASSMVQALMQFTQQSGLQLAFPTSGTDDIRAPRVIGDYTPKAALDQLLAGSGLRYEFANEKTVSVRSNDSLLATPSNAAVDNIRLAQAVRTGSVASTQEELASTVRSDPKPTQDVSSRMRVPEILVSGSRVLNMDIARTKDDAQPYVIFSRDLIEKSGARDVGEFLRDRLTASTTVSASAQSPGSEGNRSSVNLRGLGTDQTLILVDGHRTASIGLSGSAGQGDLNGIPLAAIERIEVLPTTASGIYGGGATGGVVNVVLRRDYSGLQTTLTYDNSFDHGGANRRAEVSAGFNLEGGRTNILLSGSYTDGTDLQVGDRDFTKRARQKILDNNPQSFYSSPFSLPLGATTNIAGVDPNTFGFTDLTLKSGAALNSPFTFVSSGYSGVASDGGASLVSNAGAFNLDLANTAQAFSNGGRRQGLLNAPTVQSFMATVRREFTSNIQAFLDLSVSKNASDFLSTPASSSFTLAATDPANPFDQAIQVTTPAFGADQNLSSTVKNRRAVGGLIVRLGGDWFGEVDYTWERNRTAITLPTFNLNEAAALAVSDGTLDVFRDTNAFPVDFSSYLLPPGGYTPANTTLKDGTLRFSGSLPWRLPGGAPTLSFALERRQEFLEDSLQIVPVSSTLNFFGKSFSRSQSVNSAYLEARVPLVSPESGIPAIRSLEMQLAARRDEYSITGASQSTWIEGLNEPAPAVRTREDLSSTDPTLGLRYQPISDITVRSSYGTGFLPPGLTQLTNTITPLDGASFLTDPRRNGEPLGVFGPVLNPSGGNPDLRPESSRSLSFGAVVTPRFVPGFRLSLDWTRIKKSDNISSDFLFSFLNQQNIDNEQFIPGFITRGEELGDGLPGPIISVNNIYLNIAKQEVEVADLALDYDISTARWGTFNLALSATKQIHNQVQTLSNAPVLEKAGTAFGGLPWRGNATVSWDLREWTASWTARYFDSYFLFDSHAVDLDQGSATIPSQMYHDFSVSYRVQAFSRLTGGGEVRLGVRNIFNKEPPIVSSGLLFGGVPYSTYGDPRLASYYLSLRANF